MEAWWKLKVAHGRHSWKAAKKAIKRVRRNERAGRELLKKMIDNATFAA